MRITMPFKSPEPNAEAVFSVTDTELIAEAAPRVNGEDGKAATAIAEDTVAVCKNQASIRISGHKQSANY